MTLAISADEIIAKGEDLLASGSARPGMLREWYDALYAERIDKRSRIRIADGTSITLGKSYDFVILNHKDKPTNLRGWEASHRATWSDNYVVLRSPGSKERPYAGRNREVHPSAILSATEVTS